MWVSIEAWRWPRVYSKRTFLCIFECTPDLKELKNSYWSGKHHLIAEKMNCCLCVHQSGPGSVALAQAILTVKLPSGSELIFHSLAKIFGEIILPESKNFWHLILKGMLMLQISHDLEPLWRLFSWKEVEMDTMYYIWWLYGKPGAAQCWAVGSTD